MLPRCLEVWNSVEYTLKQSTVFLCKTHRFQEELHRMLNVLTTTLKYVTTLNRYDFNFALKIKLIHYITTTFFTRNVPLTGV